MEEYQSYHIVAQDEVHVSKNLVYKKLTGELIGYCNLSDAAKAVKTLEQVLGSSSTEPVIDETPPITAKMLSFMIIGVSSGIVEVVANYCTDNLDKDFLYNKLWGVVEELELAGIKVMGTVGDGCAVNRAFIEMHTPITITKSGVIFDTINIYGDCRPFYFFSDPPHLLKTIRNCFVSQGRKLHKNGQDILWKFIVRLYHETKSSTLKKAFKLNAQAVFLTSYSRMRVIWAAQVMSSTVAKVLRQKNYPGVEETAKFIEWVNKFFDCLNGNYSVEGARKRNEDLNAYTNIDDPRFKVLEDFLEYLDEWAEEVNALPISGEKKEKMMLSRQTLYGIEMSTRSFIAAVKYLLNAGTKCILARVFSQDLLEHYFGRQRGKCGSSNNPNAEEFLRHGHSFKLLGAVGAKRKGSNVEVEDCGPSVDATPLPKRQKSVQKPLGFADK